jgi:hypothetical protein
MMVFTDKDTATLSAGSRIVTVTNPRDSACDGQGVKNSAITQHAATLTLFALVLVGAVINVSNA